MRSPDLEPIQAKLGWRVYWFKQVSSTQDLAQKLLRDGPVLVGADEQVRGRGRFRRTWWSAEGGLYLSIGLKETGPAQGLIGALATARAIELETGLSIQIRWPNDLILNAHKVAGILCESDSSGTILGIGVNLNQRGFPEEVQGATSLAIELGREVDRQPLILKIIEELSKKRDGEWLEELKGRLLGLNQEVKVELLRRTISGVVIDLDELGRLVLRSQSGRLLLLSAGQVRSLR